jgi:hypothetical protein
MVEHGLFPYRILLPLSAEVPAPPPPGEDHAVFDYAEGRQ